MLSLIDISVSTGSSKLLKIKMHKYSIWSYFFTLPLVHKNWYIEGNNNRDTVMKTNVAVVHMWKLEKAVY